jgi:hypothetical protein
MLSNAGPRSGQPSTVWNLETAAKVTVLVATDCQMTKILTVDQLHINWETLCLIPHEDF